MWFSVHTAACHTTHHTVQGLPAFESRTLVKSLYRGEMRRLWPSDLVVGQAAKRTQYTHTSSTRVTSTWCASRMHHSMLVDTVVRSARHASYGSPL